MIPYQDLADALERWRVRNGKPTMASTTPAPRPVIPAAAPAASVAAPAAAAPRPAPPAPPPGRTVHGVPPPPQVAALAAQVQAQGARPPTTLPADELHELDADVLDEPAAEDVYDNEGSDFAMTFGGPPAAASGSIGHDEDEHTSMATAPVTALDDPFDAQTAAVRGDVWPEVAEAREWPPEQTNATAYGWGASHRPAAPGRATTDDDDGGSTVVGSTKPRG